MDKFEELSKEELLTIYRNYEKMKAKETIEVLKRRERTKKYYKTEKGKQKLKESQKRYYLKNRDKILAKYHEKRKKLKEEEQNKEVTCSTT